MIVFSTTGKVKTFLVYRLHRNMLWAGSGQPLTERRTFTPSDSVSPFAVPELLVSLSAQDLFSAESNGDSMGLVSILTQGYFCTEFYRVEEGVGGERETHTPIHCLPTRLDQGWG